MRQTTRRFLLALSICALIPAAFAEDIKLPFNKLTLNAHLEKAADWPQRVILMTHGTLAHNKMEIMSALQTGLKNRGFSSLSINLSYAINDRSSAMLDCAITHKHRHTDALDEIGAWLAWMKAQGAKDVTLLGHSRGGNQTAWFAAERDDAVIHRVVLVAPATYDADRAAKGYQKNNGKALPALIQKATAAKPETVLEHTDLLYCKDTKVSAAAFVSYYQPDAHFDTPQLLPKISKPVLVIAGTQDETVPDVEAKTKPFADDKRVQLKVVEGADHFFLDLYADDVADSVAKFIQ